MNLWQNVTMTDWTTPLHLKAGDTVAIAAPSGSFDLPPFKEGVTFLENWGLTILIRDDIGSKHHYFAGTDDRRADELNEFIANPEVSAIFFARGGYGMQRILPLLDITPLHNSPKVIMGYSDITPLFSLLNAHKIGGTLYGPTVANHVKEGMPPATLTFMKKFLMESAPVGELPTDTLRVIKSGKAKCRLLGGCLSLLSTSIGTHFDLPEIDHILFLEDYNEPTYRLDRMLTHLKNAGKFRHTKGIIFGSLNPSDLNENSGRLDAILDEVLHDFPGPIVANFSSGHFPFNHPFISLPLGTRIEINTDQPKISIIDPFLL